MILNDFNLVKISQNLGEAIACIFDADQMDQADSSRMRGDMNNISSDSETSDNLDLEQIVWGHINPRVRVGWGQSKVFEKIEKIFFQNSKNKIIF